MVAGNAGLVVVAVAVHGWMDGTASSINQINAIIQLWWCISETRWHLEPEQRQQPQQTAGDEDNAHTRNSIMWLLLVLVWQLLHFWPTSSSTFPKQKHECEKIAPRKIIAIRNREKICDKHYHSFKGPARENHCGCSASTLTAGNHLYRVQMESNRTHHSGWLLTKCCYDQIPIECGISKLLQLRFRSDSWPCAFGMIVSVTFRVIANTKSIYKNGMRFLVFFYKLFGKPSLVAYVGIPYSLERIGVFYLTN